VVPLASATGETENLMNAAAFAKMKKSAFFINVSAATWSTSGARKRRSMQAPAGCRWTFGRAPDQMPTPRLAARRDVIATPHARRAHRAAIEHQSLETVAQAAEILKGRSRKARSMRALDEKGQGMKPY